MLNENEFVIKLFINNIKFTKTKCAKISITQLA